MIERDNFQDAIAYATAEVRHWLEGGEIIGDECAEEVLLWWMLDMSYEYDINGKTYIDAPPWARGYLYVRALSGEAARRLMARMVAGKLLSNLPLSEDEAQFAGLELAGLLPALRTKPGRKREVNFSRNMFLVSLVQEVKNRFGLAQSRNDAARKENSACDAVSLAFINCKKHEVTFKTVKDVCNDRSLRRVLSAISKEMDESEMRRKEPVPNALANFARRD